MGNNVEQRSIDQAKTELKRVDQAFDKIDRNLRSPPNIKEAMKALTEARDRLNLALRHLQS